jgi:energy-coupling factor transporter ATP-binding protein EcfA2
MGNRRIKERLLADLQNMELEVAIDSIDYQDDEEKTYHSEDGEKKMDFAQWSVMGDGSYIAAPKAEKELPAGLYEFEWNNRANEWCVMKQAINTDELYELPTEEIGEILTDIKSFWKKADLYKSYKLMHKRGILLYGDPGCGKSGILQLCMMHIIKELSGVVINIKNEDSIKAYVEMVPKLRQIEPGRPLVVIIEDIDSVAGDSNYSTSVLLNILDGIKQIENVVYIATTNYPEKLEERITNRPSRFDRRYYVAPPSREVRKSYLENKIGNNKIDIDIEKWLDDTEDLSMSHLKELFISVVLLDNKYENAIEHLKGMKKTPRRKNQKEVGFGSH